MYGWDSYFEALGLMIDGRLDLAKNMVDNFVYEIKHYGKILNANRSYSLTRSQPPFLTEMSLRVFERLPADREKENVAWLHEAFAAAIREYYEVWMSPPRLDPKTGLSRYHPTGIGMPPETEASHFDHVVEPYAKALGVDVKTYQAMYNDGRAKEPHLDTYFIHDRAVRESGHDTTYRLEKKCADMATIDLQCLLYKYEVDIGTAIRDIFGGRFEMPPARKKKKSGSATPDVETPEPWFERARRRKALIDKYCWNEEKGMYFDYDTRLEEQSVYESVTAFWALWAGCASEAQAARLLDVGLRLFEVVGGLVCGTEHSRGKISLDRPNRQWDYPFGGCARWPLRFR
ncbi:MAG: glycoside hydrolase [Olpidium bornovanus]|uniref:Trehalase n=1 Tax=Olpidium bornovanus TaxID=278681 RepID=A0A8H8DHZ1_9FUNG|nr:MAG: glycoside hydrolase [Olpidium bornovanus]